MPNPLEQLARMQAQGEEATRRIDAEIERRGGAFIERTSESGLCTARVDLRGRLYGVTFRSANVMAETDRQALAEDVTATIQAAQDLARREVQAISERVWEALA
jgi:hypothetical protein